MMLVVPTAALAETDHARDNADTTPRTTDRPAVTDQTTGTPEVDIRPENRPRLHRPETDRPTRGHRRCDRNQVTVDGADDCRKPDDHPRWTWLRRCYNWVVEHTDIRPQDDARFWWRLCHRIHWNKVHGT